MQTLILVPKDYGSDLPSELNTFTLGVNLPRSINCELYECIIYVDASDIDNPIEIVLKG